MRFVFHCNRLLNELFGSFVYRDVFRGVLVTGVFGFTFGALNATSVHYGFNCIIVGQAISVLRNINVNGWCVVRGMRDGLGVLLG